MSSLKRAVTVALYALAAASWLTARKQKQTRRQVSQSHPERTSRELESGHPRVRVTQQSLGDGVEVVRFRGSLPDVLDALHNREPEQPPALPETLDWRALPKYYGGCPHCGKRSLHGESLWMYHVVSRTREPGDNVTTFIARCRGCRRLMLASIDHDE
jgi:hypothetical protein